MITARGELDLAGSSALAEVMARLIERNPGNSTLDLSGLTFVDAAGISCVIGFRRSLAEVAATMTIDRATDRVHRVFAIVALAHLLESATSESA